MYRIWWNNICLLTRLEENFLTQKLAEPLTEDPKGSLSNLFTIDYFGLGRMKTIRETLKRAPEMPDFIVSTDLEIFQNPEYDPHFEPFIWDSRPSHLAPWMPAPWLDPDHPILKRHPHLEPFIVIPLVMVTKSQEIAKQITHLEQLPTSGLRFGFGGIHNSAGESLQKTLKALYGEGFAQVFTAAAVKATMPAQAFHHMMTGHTDVAIVPTIFALRQGAHQLHMIWPAEGAIAIPSYIAVRNTVPQAIRHQFFEAFTGPDLQQLLVVQGDVLATHPRIQGPPSAQKHCYHLSYGF